MFDKLDDLLLRYEDLMNELNEPSVVNDQERFRKLMKEQSYLQPIETHIRNLKSVRIRSRRAFRCWRRRTTRRCGRC